MQRPVLTHFVSAIIVFCMIVFLVLKGLNVYTQHNKAIVIPDVKGLLMEDASSFLNANGLRYTVVDSVYSKEVKPGAIWEIFPAIGSKVKQGRFLYITINSHTVQMAAIPDIKDISLRQGEAQLNARGFKSVEIQYVQGRYRDLIIGIELQGRELDPGEMIPLTSALILKVGDGGREIGDILDETLSDSIVTVE